MMRQRINSYESRTIRGLELEIASDAKNMNMAVKTLALASHVRGYSTYHSAIVVFEEVKEND